MIPHKCPVCDGMKKVYSAIQNVMEPTIPCPACKMTGIIWEGEKGCQHISVITVNGVGQCCDCNAFLVKESYVDKKGEL